jgi:hypothetical protein
MRLSSARIMFGVCAGLGVGPAVAQSVWQSSFSVGHGEGTAVEAVV